MELGRWGKLVRGKITLCANDTRRRTSKHWSERCQAHDLSPPPRPNDSSASQRPSRTRPRRLQPSPCSRAFRESSRSRVRRSRRHLVVCPTLCGGPYTSPRKNPSSTSRSHKIKRCCEMLAWLSRRRTEPPTQFCKIKGIKRHAPRLRAECRFVERVGRHNRTAVCTHQRLT